MIEQPEITHLNTRPTAIIHLQLPGAEMPKQFGPAVGELIAAIVAQGQPPAGPVFAHHLRMDPDLCSVPDHFDFEVSVPVNLPVAASGRMKPSRWPAMKVAKTTYWGPYEGLSEAWGEFMSWIEAQGHKPALDLYECYVTGPHSSSDPSTWRTELIRPLLD